MKSIWNTFRYTFSWYRWQILGWGLGIASLGLILVPFFDVFMERQEDFMNMIANYPPEFLAFFGGDASSLVSPEGYLGMYGFSLLPLIIGFFALMAGSGLLANDEERGRLDLILAHPVGRTAFFWGRILAFLAAIISVLGLGWLGFSVLLGRTTMGISWGRMALPFLPLLAQALIYGMLALLLSMVLPSRSLAAALTGLVMVTGYLLDSLATLNETFGTLASWLPYAYFQGSEAFDHLNLSWLFGLVGVSSILAILAWWRFNRRDIRLGGEGSWKLPVLGRRHSVTG